MRSVTIKRMLDIVRVVANGATSTIAVVVSDLNLFNFMTTDHAGYRSFTLYSWHNFTFTIFLRVVGTENIL